MKTYCYVTTECCRVMRTAKPGSEVDGRPVSKHGDFMPWVYGKRETLKMCGEPGYRAWAALAVCREMGWEDRQRAA